MPSMGGRLNQVPKSAMSLSLWARSTNSSNSLEAYFFEVIVTHIEVEEIAEEAARIYPRYTDVAAPSHGGGAQVCDPTT